jgi:hypothetical protein
MSSHLLCKLLRIKIYTTTSLPFFVWSLTLREELKLRVLENGVLRRIFGPKTEEVAGGWRRLHNEELHALYTS